MKFNGLEIYETSINIDDPEDGVFIMSIVNDPAVQKNFLKFSTQQKSEIALSIDDEKKIITGVALRADYPIYRKDGEHEFYINFKPEEIEKAMCKFMKDQNGHKVNINHFRDTDNVYLIESFIMNDKLRPSYEEFQDVKNGSWIVSYLSLIHI